MIKKTNIKPFNDELPSNYADRLGQNYSLSVSSGHKKEKGQFFTPIEIARFMGNLTNQTKTKIKILDPGCGTAILSCALIEKLVERKIKEIELIAYEIDNDLLPFTEASLNYLKDWLQLKKIQFKYLLDANDFVFENKECFEYSASLFFEPKNEIYDVVISNPPYFKISKEDKRALAAKSIVYGQPNIYSIFLITSAKLLKSGGELIFITPRSFTSGNYFRVFRREFFKAVQLEKIHLFGSRKDTFNRDSVLQEVLIIKGRKEKLNGNVSNVLLTHSNGIKDINHSTAKEYQLNELINFDSSEKILHLPINDVEDKVIKLFKSWNGSLNQYNIQISTGPVVSFRSTKFLFEKYQNENVQLVPLYQLQNTAKMIFEWPVFKNNKAQYIQFCEQTKSALIPNKNYIFLRRFSAKDDKSRLIATPYFVDITQFEFIGVENHLNYIYRPKGNLERNEILGLAALLNSNLFDIYFRTFNGNINVSATELREIPLPPLEDIKQIGDQIILSNNFSDSKVDRIVNQYFDLKKIFPNHEQS
jgi:adenine-specific DNA-methyltransferase